MNRPLATSFAGTLIALVIIAPGCRPIGLTRLLGPKPSPSPSEGPLTRPYRGTRANTGILSEMVQVVLGRKPEGGEGYFAIVSAMNQGASIEGVYHGLVYTDEFLEREKNGAQPSPAQLRAFVDELMELERVLPQRTSFNERSAAPRERILPPGVAEDSVGQIRYGAAGTPEPTVASDEVSLERYLKIFAKARLYTMKRVLGEEAVKVIAELQKRDPSALAEWYSAWVVRLAGKKVDFGLPERNRADQAFHRDWANRVGPDLVTWEVLNRLHRLLNSPTPSAAVEKGKS